MELDQNQNPINPEDGNGGQPITPEKTFTQAEVDGIIAGRLSREGIHDAKEIVELLKDFGYEGTPAEIKAVLREQAKEVKAQREQASKQQELEELEEQATQYGSSPELLREIRELKNEIKALKAKDEAKERQVQEQVAIQKRVADEIAQFKGKYPDIDHEKLAQNPKFSKFLNRANPGMSLLEIYEDYVELVGGAEAAAIEKVKSNLDRTTSSGKNKQASDAGGTYGLTAKQQELAKEAGIPFKKFAENLSLIRK